MFSKVAYTWCGSGTNIRCIFSRAWFTFAIIFFHFIKIINYSINYCLCLVKILTPIYIYQGVCLVSKLCKKGHFSTCFVGFMSIIDGPCEGS